MADKESGGMKSAYELAMEKLDERDGKVDAVTEEQKEAIAEVDSRTKAGIAELEIVIDGKIAEAQAVGGIDAVREMQAEKTREIARVNEQAEDEKERIRNLKPE